MCNWASPLVYTMHITHICRIIHQTLQITRKIKGEVGGQYDTTTSISIPSWCTIEYMHAKGMGATFQDVVEWVQCCYKHVEVEL